MPQKIPHAGQMPLKSEKNQKNWRESTQTVGPDHTSLENMAVTGSFFPHKPRNPNLKRGNVLIELQAGYPKRQAAIRAQ